jgi:hypothetical protein
MRPSGQDEGQDSQSNRVPAVQQVSLDLVGVIYRWDAAAVKTGDREEPGKNGPRHQATEVSQPVFPSRKAANQDRTPRKTNNNLQNSGISSRPRQVIK